VGRKPAKMNGKPANPFVAGHLLAKTCEATYRNRIEAGRSSRACMRTRRRIGNGGLVDAELVQGQFTLLFGEICDAYPRVSNFG
jgi:hypothetical protein